MPTIVVLAGTKLGCSFNRVPRGYVDSMALFDGRVYRTILEQGYHYEPGSSGTVGFFPLYPLLGRITARLTGLSPTASLVAISHVFFLLSLILLGKYLAIRNRPDGDGRNTGRFEDVEGGHSPWKGCALTALSLWPTTLFFRMAYTESLFLWFAILSLYAMGRRWPPMLIAAIVGVATASRPVAISLLVPFVLHILRRDRPLKIRIASLSGLLLVASSGILIFFIFIYEQFNDLTAFSRTHDLIRMRSPVPLGEKILAYLAWEPIWGVYDASQPGYWAHFDPPVAILNWRFANPIYFAIAASSIALGWWKRWLTDEELALSVPLLAIPYLTRGFDMCMQSHSRYSCVVFPMYIVIAHLLARLHAWVRAVVYLLFGVGLFVYSALFAAGYEIY